MTSKEWIERLRDMDPNESICIHLWVVDDIIEKADDMGVDLTYEEAREILEDIQDNIDCDLGVTWTTLRVNIEEFVNTRKQK